MGAEGWLAAELAAVAADQRAAMVAEFIEQQVVELLRGDAPDGPLPRSFFRIGMDSLQAVALLARLEFALGVDVPPEAMDWPSIDGLAGFLTGTVLPAGGSLG